MLGIEISKDLKNSNLDTILGIDSNSFSLSPKEYGSSLWLYKYVVNSVLFLFT